MENLISQAEKRRRNLRIVLFIIILATLPFYCAGFVLWGTAPATGTNNRFSTSTATFTPIGVIVTPSRTLEPSVTPLGTQLSPLLPTPIQFQPGGGSGGNTNPVPIPPTATFPVFIPTATFAPTLTPFPSSTPIPPPTQTPIPIPSSTPIPTDTPIPIVTDTSVPIPSDTAIPLVDVTVEVGP
jgi:hypothetical protein